MAEHHYAQALTQHGHEGEEPQRRPADLAVAALGDLPVERAVPGEEPLAELDGAGQAAEIVVEVAGAVERREHDHP